MTDHTALSLPVHGIQTGCGVLCMCSLCGCESQDSCLCRRRHASSSDSARWGLHCSKSDNAAVQRLLECLSQPIMASLTSFMLSCPPNHSLRAAVASYAFFAGANQADSITLMSRCSSVSASTSQKLCSTSPALCATALRMRLEAASTSTPRPSSECWLCCQCD